jgi:predicted HD phosphohydrolase
MTTTSFKSMDESTKEQWDHIVLQTISNQKRVACQIKSMLLYLENVTDGFAVDQLTHSLQTATRAENDGASDEMVAACLVHDIGKAVSVINHPAIAADILKPYVNPDLYYVIFTHQDFQGKYYYGYLGMNPNLRDNYKEESWYQMACEFSDEWDQKSFDPNYPTKSLDYFEALIADVFSKPRY